MEYHKKYKKRFSLLLGLNALHKEYFEGLSLDSFQIMTTLYFSDEGRVPRKALQDLLKIKGSQLTRHTQTLIKAGIVYYEASPSDGRGKVLCLTTLGMNLRKLFLKIL